MCLVKQQRKQHCIATEEFECFKVIRYVYRKWYDGKYIRNFYETNYVEDFVTIPSLVYAEPYGCYKQLDNEEWLHGGVIHSFRFEEDAKKYCEWCNDCNVTWCKHVVVRCVIPAGTRYWYGKYHWSDYEKPYLCFGSEKIYYDKIIS